MLAMPTTTVQNTIGVTTILTSLTKASPSGLRAVPVSGAKCPTAAPTTIASSTWA